MSATIDNSVIERAELREMARQLATGELAPRTVALDARDPRALETCWEALVAVGLDRALLDEDHDGPALTVADLLAVVEELAAGDGGVALAIVLTNAANLALGADRAAALPVGARWALVTAARDREVTVSGDGRLTGRVESVLGADGADGFVLVVRGESATAFALEIGAPGLALHPDEAQMGLRGAPAATLVLDGVHGAPVGDDATPASATDLVRAGTAFVARGIARRAYDMARDYAHERRQGGVVIARHDAVADMLGAMAVRLATRLPPCDGATAALAAKIAATADAVATTTDAVQVFGGTGYMYETGVEKLMRDAKYCQLHPEPNWVSQDALVHALHVTG